MCELGTRGGLKFSCFDTSGKRKVSKDFSEAADALNGELLPATSVHHHISMLRGQPLLAQMPARKCVAQDLGESRSLSAIELAQKRHVGDSDDAGQDWNHVCIIITCMAIALW